MGVVVVALFLAVVAVGHSKEEGSSAGGDGFVERLAELAGDPSAIPLDAVSAGCTDGEDPTLLVFTGGCTVVVGNDGELRLLGLLALSPVLVVAPAPEGDLEVEDDVAAGKEVRVAVGEGQTEVDLECGAGLGAQCRVRLVGG